MSGRSARRRARPSSPGRPDAGGRGRAAGGPGAVAVAHRVPARLLPDLALRDPGTRRVATLMAPATLGVAAVQVNVVINSSFASLVSDGAISWLSYAFRLMQLPIGVFGVAVGTTSLTHLSRDAAARGLGRAADDAAARPADGAVPDRARRRSGWRCSASDRAAHLPARPVLRARDRSRRRTRSRLRHRPRRLRGDQGRCPGVLRARPHARSAGRQPLGRGREPGLELRDLPPLRPCRPGGRDLDRGAGQLLGPDLRLSAQRPRPLHPRPRRPVLQDPRRRRRDGRLRLAHDALPRADARRPASSIFAVKPSSPSPSASRPTSPPPAPLRIEEASTLVRRVRR